MFRFKYRAAIAAAGLSLPGVGMAADPVPVVVESAPPVVAPAPCPADCPPPAPAGFDWKKVPRNAPFPRPGDFPITPTGPGYYSLLDQLRGQELPAPPKYPYPRFGLILPSFFDVDNFGYLDDPKNTERDFFDPLKRVRIGNNILFTTGGDVRVRYESATNDRLTRTDNTYQLTRARVYADVWYRDDFRVYAEFIGAYSQWQDLAPLPIDENKADFQNLFVEMKVAEIGGEPTYVRVGRQELLLGSQRLVSPLEWANTRRTFQGVRGFRRSENLDVDVFWSQPVVPNANRLDSVDNNQNFAGAWVTYRPAQTVAFDAYYLMLDNTNDVTQLGISRGNFTRHTIGGRASGTAGNVLFDSEGAVQLGTQDGRTVTAFMATHGVGYNFKETPWTPTLWAMYDYASGGGATTGVARTFNQQFPFGHYYLGWIDQVGRSNIHDLNFHLFAYPAKWLTLWGQFHSFWLADKTDALYNASGNAIRRDATGRSGSHVGEELDLTVNVHLSKHADILTGYSYLFGGEFLRNTATATAASNSGLFYLQYSYRW